MDNELLNRRLFFKKAAKTTLPILMGASMLSSLASCGGGDDDDDDYIGGCTGSSCSSECTSSCTTGCNTACTDSSSSSTCSSCANSCSNSSTNNSSDDKTNTSDISSFDGTVGDYKYVDLGLSVKWATCNIGTSSPEKYGVKYEFSKGINSYKYVSDIANVYRNEGYRAGDSISGSSFDQVCSKYGTQWKMPTKADVEELVNNCSKEEIEYNGSTIYKYTSKKNKHAIFFPKAAMWTGTFSSLSAGGAIAAIYSPDSSKTIGRGFVGDDKYYIRPITTESGGSSTGCNNGCKANCSSNSTSSTCSSCASSCSSGCKQQCDYNCAATCKSHCYGHCNDTCGGGCKAASKGSSCSGCARTCNNRCYSACTYACSSNCQSSCVKGSK